MTFEEILAHIIEVLQREGRISYRALQRRFDLDDAYLDDVKVELIEAKQLARDENGRILVWAEQATTTAPPTHRPGRATWLLARSPDAAGGVCSRCTRSP